MTDISEVAQKLAPEAIVSLYSLDLTSLGGTVHNFVAGAEHGEAIVFNSISYNPLDVEVSGFEMNGAGALPQPTIRIANREGFVQTMLATFGDIIGAKFTRVRTFGRFLDNGSEPDPGAYFGPDIFIVEQKTAENAIFVEFTLSASIDQEGKMLPGRQVIRETCLWRYRVWNPNTSSFDYTKAQCPYVGSGYYDINNQATTAENDQCSRRLSGCKLRFGASSPLPFGGFPGVSRVRG
jgi:lambda family phage minor tail protein L